MIEYSICNEKILLPRHPGNQPARISVNRDSAILVAVYTQFPSLGACRNKQAMRATMRLRWQSVLRPPTSENAAFALIGISGEGCHCLWA